MGNAPHKLLQKGKDDMPIDINEKSYYLKMVKKKEDMTGWERLKAVFENEDGQYTPEIVACKDAILLSFLVSGTFGGVARSRAAYQDFFRSFGHEAFETPMRAKMLLQERVVVAFGTGFWRVGWRIGLFTGMFVLASTCVTAYHGKYGPVSVGAGGATAGMLYKFRQGPKATLAGGIVGAGLGLLGGALTVALFKGAGVSYDAIIAEEYKRRALETEKVVHAMHEAREEMDKAHSLSEFQDQLLTQFDAEPVQTKEKVGASGTTNSGQKYVDSLEQKA